MQSQKQGSSETHLLRKTQLTSLDLWDVILFSFEMESRVALLICREWGNGTVN